MTHAKLVAAGKRWLNSSWRNATNEGHGHCAVILSELVCNTYTGEVPDVIGWHSGRSILIECKTSMSDFRADKKKFFRKNAELGVGSQRWYLAPAGVLRADDIPAEWGLLEADDSGKITVVKPSGNHESNRQTEVTLLLSVIRREKIQQPSATRGQTEMEMEGGDRE